MSQNILAPLLREKPRAKPKIKLTPYRDCFQCIHHRLIDDYFRELPPNRIVCRRFGVVVKPSYGQICDLYKTPAKRRREKEQDKELWRL